MAVGDDGDGSAALSNPSSRWLDDVGAACAAAASATVRSDRRRRAIPVLCFVLSLTDVETERKVKEYASVDLLTRRREKKTEADALATRRARVVANFRRLSPAQLEQLLSNMINIDKLPDKVMLTIFSYLPHQQVLKCARVCNKWRVYTLNPALWKNISLRPSYEGLQVVNLDYFTSLIGSRFTQLRLIDLPTDIITPTVLTELANRCPKLHFMTLDFSTAMQLHDFADLQSFPSRLRSLTLCLSENIFLEGFLRKIYTFIASVQILHIIGTYEKIEDEEEEVYETVNIHKLKQYMPALRVVNLWGVRGGGGGHSRTGALQVLFVTDEHVDSLSSNCAHLQCLCVNYCQKVTGTSLRTVIQRCKKLTCLLLAHASLDNKLVAAVEWDKSQIRELDVTATELKADTLIGLLTRLPHLRWLSAGFLEYFTDQVMEAWMDSGSLNNLQALNLNTCDSLNETVLSEFITRHGHQLHGLNLGGNHKLLENFWMTNVPKLRNIRTLVMGIAEDCCVKVTSKIHIDQFIDCIALSCSHLRRLEIRWDDQTLRFSEKSNKFIDVLRMRCLKLHSIVLSDGKYYELVRANFERADRMSVVRTTEMCHTSIIEMLSFYKELLFN